MSFNQLKTGNLLQYVGRLGEFYSRNALVISIDADRNENNSFLLKLKNWKGEEREIRAYQQEVWPITVEPAHLEKLGFGKDHRNVFTLEDIVLVRPIFIKGELNTLHYIDKGFVVMEKNLELPLKEEAVDASTTAVTSLHTLQNYLQGKIIKQINWEMFL